MEKSPKQPEPAANRATRLTLFCRGATAANRQARFGCGDELLPKELPLVRAMVREFPRFDVVRHAPEVPAIQTAVEFFSGATSCEALRDVNFGEWGDRAVADVAAESSADFQRWMADPAYAPPGGESLETAQIRAAGWLEGYHSTGGHVLAVTHPTVVKLVFLHVVGAPLTSVWRVDVEPLGWIRLTSDSRRWALREFSTRQRNDIRS